MKKTLRNLFYKDSRMTIIREKTSPMPDGGLAAPPITLNMLTISPYEERQVTLKGGESNSMSGTYGLSPFEIFNPFKETSNLAWLMMYQQGILKDVSAEIDHPKHDPVLVTVNNPQVGYPYVVFYDNPIEVVIPSPIVGDRFNLDEGETVNWTSSTGLKITVTRDSDSDCKEFKIHVKN
jgi:hypothetical protein